MLAHGNASKITKGLHQLEETYSLLTCRYRRLKTKLGTKYLLLLLLLLLARPSIALRPLSWALSSGMNDVSTPAF